MPQTPSQQADDIVFVERRREPRIIVSIPGRYALASRRDTRGNRREFACRIVNISLHAMTLVVPVNGPVAERVITHCDEFGKLGGQIVRVLDRGFVMTIAATKEERAKLADRIDWYEKNKNHEVSDGRMHKRIAPKDPRSTLVLADESRLDCFVIDMSPSGVAISADVKPQIGTPLAVGRLVGRVVRHRADGFAVQFIELQDIDGLEQKLIQP
jgi:hypothetical protein